MKSKTEILARIKGDGESDLAVSLTWIKCLMWVLGGEGWRDVNEKLPLFGNPVLAWDEDSKEFLIARFYHNQGEPPTWVVCDKDRRTNITRWTYLE